MRGGRRGEARVARTEGRNKPTPIQPDNGLKVVLSHHPFTGCLPGRGKMKMIFSCLIKVCKNMNNYEVKKVIDKSKVKHILGNGSPQDTEEVSSIDGMKPRS